MRTLRSKLFVLLLLLIGLFVGAIAFVRQSGQVPVLLLQSDSEQRSSNLLKRVLKNNQEKLTTYVYDYSLWDDMVQCVRHHDRAWGDLYVNVSLKTFHNDAAWICDTLFQVVCATDVLGDKGRLPLPVPGDNPRQVFANNDFPCYYWLIDSTVLEVSAAPIQFADDTLRQGAPQGYYFVAKLWTDDAVDDLSLYAEATVSTAPVNNVDRWTSDPKYGILRFADTLYDWQGRPVSLVRGEGFSKPLLDLYRSADIRIWVLAILAVVLLAAWWLSLTFWIARPLRSISDALADHSIEPIKVLVRKQDEIGKIAGLIARLFEQRASVHEVGKDGFATGNCRQGEVKAEHPESVTH